MSWSNFERLQDEFPKDRHVWHYVKGVLQPLVLSMKDRMPVDLAQQERHEEAVERFIDALEPIIRADNNKRRGYIPLKKKYTRTWKVIERAALLKGHFVIGSYLEEAWEFVKLMKTILIILLVPAMFALNETGKPYTVALGILSLIGFLATYLDWHRPFWLPGSGNLITSPPMIFHYWFKT